METEGRLNDALEQMWKKFLPQMEERLAALDEADKALIAGNFTAEQRAAAHTAAHKLAGILGTFGLHAGTTLAREAEIHYHGEAVIDPHWATRLSEISAQLRTMIESRNNTIPSR